VSEGTSQSVDADRKGLGGALSLLIFLLVVGALYGLSKTFVEIDTAERQMVGLTDSPQWQSYKNTTWLLWAVDFGVRIFAAVRLVWFRNPATIAIVIACLWFSGPIQIGLANLFLSADGDLTEPAMLSSIIPAIWTAYLLLSKRVKNTYADGVAS